MESSLPAAAPARPQGAAPAAFAAVLRHELRLHLARRGRALLSLVVGALVALAVVRGAERTHDRAQAVAEAATRAEAAWRAQPSGAWLEAATRAGRWVYLAPRPESALLDGLADLQDPGVRVRAGVAPAHRLDLADGVIGWAPRSAGFGSLDLGFVLLVLAPLWAIVLTYDAICGEKAQGTLRAVFSRPVGDREYLLARMAAAAGLVLVVVLLPLALGAGVAAARGHLTLPSGLGISAAAGLGAIPAAAVGLFLAVVLAHLLAYLGLGFLVSTLTAEARVSLAVLIAVWAGSTFFVPRFGLLVADQLSPMPSRMQLEIAKRQALDDARREFNEEHHFQGGAAPAAERLLVGERALDREVELERDFAAARARSRRLAVTLVSLSPMAVAAFALMEVTATGPERPERFAAAVAEYRRDFSRHFAAAARPGQAADPGVLSRTPAFTFAEAAGGATAARVAPALGWLGLLALATHLAAIARFRRYDRR